jgi:hypothetical protein
MALRDLILKVVPSGMAASMEAESREWFVVCGSCGHARSIWDLGGLRYKAKGNPRRRMTCPACGQRNWHRVERRRGGEPAA